MRSHPSVAATHIRRRHAAPLKRRSRQPDDLPSVICRKEVAGSPGSVCHLHLHLIDHLGHAWRCPSGVRSVLDGLPR
jgi:hypothetical protein